MLKTFFANKSFIRPKKIKKHFITKKTLTPIKLANKNIDNIFIKKKNTAYNLKKIINKNEKEDLTIFNFNKKVKNSRNINDKNNLNGLKTDFINTTSNGNNNSYLNATYVKTTTDTNMTKTKIAKEKENISFINENNNTLIYFTPSTNYQSSNVNNKNTRKRIKIPKQKEKYILSKNKKKDINNTFIIPSRLNSLINVQKNIINPIRQKAKISYKKSMSLNKKVNKIKEKINLINIERKSLDEKNILIKKSKIKNIYKLYENKMESISEKEKIKEELKKEIEKIDLKINKLKKETNDMNINKEKMKEEIIKDKNEIMKFKKDIENINYDKKKVNAMLILLHKRIIDIKDRIKKRDEHNLYLDKSFFEFNQRFQNLI